MAGLRRICRGDKDGSSGVLFTLMTCDVTEVAAGQALALVIWLKRRPTGRRPEEETETPAGP